MCSSSAGDKGRCLCCLGASPAAVFIYMKDCFHFKGDLDSHNYSDVSLSQVFSESKRSEFVIVKRKFDGVFFYQ